MFFEISGLKNFALFTKKCLCWSLFLIKGLELYQKQTSTQVFSCGYCEIFKKSFFYRALLVVASELSEPEKIFYHDSYTFFHYTVELKIQVFSKNEISKSNERKLWLFEIIFVLWYNYSWYFLYSHSNLFTISFFLQD